MATIVPGAGRLFDQAPILGADANQPHQEASTPAQGHLLPPLTYTLRARTDRGCSWTVTATEADDTGTTEPRRLAAGIGHLETP
ncbi:hypothetical protein [Streptomyces sp. NPDC090798]|uniref:hypothetical protein n=1 Tax=Streptomyces sp. NPDC090798 TaxID=3365968 RepID=UPI0038225357